MNSIRDDKKLPRTWKIHGRDLIFSIYDIFEQVEWSEKWRSSESHWFLCAVDPCNRCVIRDGKQQNVNRVSPSDSNIRTTARVSSVRNQLKFIVYSMELLALLLLICSSLNKNRMGSGWTSRDGVMIEIIF